MTPRPTLRGRFAAATLTATIAIGAGAIVVAPTAYAAPGSCASSEIIAVPGTWETNKNANPNAPVGMLKAITDKVEAKSGGTVNSIYPAYEATAFDQGVAYADSQADGVKAVTDTLRSRASRCPSTTFALIGYSQGADVAGDVAESISQGRGPISASKLRGVVLIADPRRGTPGETTVGPNPPGNGIAGPRKEGFKGIEVATICDPAPDLYCATPADDTLLNSIGSVLGNAGASGQADTPSNPADAAVADTLGELNIDAFKTGPDKISQALAAGDKTGARTTARELQKQTGLFRSIAENINAGYAAATLSDFSRDTAQFRASTVLTSVKNVDIDNVSRALDKIADGAESLGANQLLDSVATMTDQLGPLTGVGGSDITAASRIVRGVQPVAMLRQASLTSGKVARVDFQGIVADLTTLGVRAAEGNFPAIPDTINALNTKLVGVVEAVDSIDLDPLIAILQTMPIGTPERLAGDVLKVINALDLTALAQNVALVIKYLMSGDLLAIPPLILDTVAIAADTSGFLDGLDLHAVTGLQDSFNVADVTTSAARAISFYSGGAHTDYGKLVVDSKGRDALTWSADYLTARLSSKTTTAPTTTSQKSPVVDQPAAAAESPSDKRPGAVELGSETSEMSPPTVNLQDQPQLDE
ncbi:cutinase family protein [Prescottella equi]